MNSTPELPESLSIILLTEGYIVQFRGASFAAGTPTQVNKIIREILKEVKKIRVDAPVHTVAPMPTVQRPVPVQPPTVQPAPDPVPDAGSGVSPQPVDLQVSKSNLIRLARGRVAGEMTDSEYYDLARQYAPGIEDLEVVDTLDQMFEESLYDQPGSIDVPPPVVVRSQPSQGAVRGVPVGMTIVEDIRPSDLVQDYISDEHGNPIGGM